ncbi:MAG: hypothetical protein IRY92_07545, partial [Dactylosporangium sp.]|nr:hypothetical protein [Dactylosporangium sp.]
EQADAVRAALAGASAPRGPARWLAELAGYVGGVLMLGGAGALLATTWDRLTDDGRAGLLAAVTVVLLGGGLVIAGGPRRLPALRAGAPARRRVVGALVALSSGTAAWTVGVLVEGSATLTAASLAGLLLAVAGYAVLPTAFGLLASVAFSVVGTLSIVDYLGAATSVTLGAVVLVLGAAWALLAALGLTPPRHLGLGLGAAIALVGAQLPLGVSDAAGWAYLLTLAVALACFALYRSQRAPVLLVAGVVGLAVVAPEAVWDLTGGAIGGALILLVAGAALIAASGIGMGMWRGSRDNASGRPRDLG